jgi:hypothetical protein
MLLLYDIDWRSPTWARAATPLGVEALEKPTFRIGVYKLFGPSSPTVLQRLAQSYLGKGSYTIISVDWSQLAQSPWFVC